MNVRALSLMTVLTLVSGRTAVDAFNSRYHEDLTMKALDDAGIRGNARKVVVAANWLTDRFSNPLLRRAVTKVGECIGSDPTFDNDDAIVASNQFHFDNLKDGSAVRSQFVDMIEKTKSYLQKGHTNEEVLIAAGITLHAIQDFYSHSNWIELGNSDIVDLDHLEKLPSGLRTGATHPMCSITGTGSHDELNKDHAKRAGHDRAFELAARASADWIKRFSAWSPSKLGSGAFPQREWGELTDVYMRRAKFVGAWDDRGSELIGVVGPNSFENDFEARFKQQLFELVQLGESRACGVVNKTDLFAVCHADQVAQCDCTSCGGNCAKPTCRCVAKPPVVVIKPVDEPVLVAVRFTSKTGHDNKDRDTKMTVKVFNASRRIQLAEIANTEGGSEYKSQDDPHQIDVPLRASLPKPQCQGFTFNVGAKGVGDDTWDLEWAAVELLFSDGTRLPRKQGPFQMKSEDSSYSESRSLPVD